jgi:hypothetical protein
MAGASLASGFTGVRRGADPFADDPFADGADGNGHGDGRDA